MQTSQTAKNLLKPVLSVTKQPVSPELPTKEAVKKKLKINQVSGEPATKVTKRSRRQSESEQKFMLPETLAFLLANSMQQSTSSNGSTINNNINFYGPV